MLGCWQLLTLSDPVSARYAFLTSSISVSLLYFSKSYASEDTIVRITTILVTSANPKTKFSSYFLIKCRIKKIIVIMNINKINTIVAVNKKPFIKKQITIANITEIKTVLRSASEESVSFSSERKLYLISIDGVEEEISIPVKSARDAASNEIELRAIHLITNPKKSEKTPINSVFDF